MTLACVKLTRNYPAQYLSTVVTKQKQKPKPQQQKTPDSTQITYWGNVTTASTEYKVAKTRVVAVTLPLYGVNQLAITD